MRLYADDQTRNNLRQSRFNSVRVHALFAKYRVAVLEGLPAHEAGIRRETFINQQKALIPIIQNVCPAFHLSRCGRFVTAFPTARSKRHVLASLAT